MKKFKDFDSFDERVKKAMDLIMYKSVSISMAVAACSIDCGDALLMLSYIKSNL